MTDFTIGPWVHHCRGEWRVGKVCEHCPGVPIMGRLAVVHVDRAGRAVTLSSASLLPDSSPSSRPADCAGQDGETCEGEI